MLREAEYRSTALFPYWNIPLLRWLVPRQRRCLVALQVVNQTLNTLISKCKRLVRTPVPAPHVPHFLHAAPPLSVCQRSRTAALRGGLTWGETAVAGGGGGCGLCGGVPERGRPQHPALPAGLG